MTDLTLYQKLTSEDNLYSAWLKVAGNMGAGGIDRISIEDFELNLYDNLRVIESLLEKEDYEFLPLVRFEADKPSGGKRILGIPAIRDRIVQQAMVNSLEPIFESEFLDCSYAYRPRRSAHQALDKVEKYIKQGCCWVVDADINSFFDTVNHAILINLLAATLRDNRIISLINNLLETGASSDGMGICQGAACQINTQTCWRTTTKYPSGGIPQAGCSLTGCTWLGNKTTTWHSQSLTKAMPFC